MDKQAEKKLQRARLIETRNTLANRGLLEDALQRRLADWLQQTDIQVLGFYFPVRGEPDLRVVIAQWVALDSRRVAALPVIVGEVLEYHAWTADAPMQAGSFCIPVPAQSNPVQPQCLLIPCVGFDKKRFRLGYGGGYYDRALATLIPRPLAVGIAFEAAKVESIDPQPHDAQLDVVITNASQY